MYQTCLAIQITSHIANANANEAVNSQYKQDIYFDTQKQLIVN